MPVESRKSFDSFGIPHQFNDTIRAELDSIITGDYPAISAVDFPVEEDQTLNALQVVGFSGKGRLVPAVFNPQGPGAKATGTLTFNSATGATVATVDGVSHSISEGTDSERATALAALINADRDGACHATVNAGVVSVFARGAGVDGNAITLAVSGSGLARSAATLSSGSGGVAPIGVLVTGITTPAGERPSLPVYVSGVFNPDRLIWDASFNSDYAKKIAFQGADTPTRILIRRIQANPLA